MLQQYLKKILIVLMVLGYVLTVSKPIHAADYLTTNQATAGFSNKISTEYPKLSSKELEAIKESYRDQYEKCLYAYKRYSVKFSAVAVEDGIRKQYEKELAAAKQKAEAEKPQKPSNSGVTTQNPNGGALSDNQAEKINEKLVAVNNVRDFIINIMLGIGVLTTILALIIQSVRLAAVANQPMLRAVCIHNILMTCVTAFVLGSLAFVVKFLFYISN